MVESIYLGNICSTCFDAVNFTESEMDDKRKIEACIAAHQLGKNIPSHITGVTTGGSKGFMRGVCYGCNTEKAGERWPLFGYLKEEKIINGVKR